MLDSLAIAALTGCFVAALFGYARIRAANALEAKLAAARRLAIVYALALLVFFIGFTWHMAQAPRLPLDLADDPASIQTYLRAMRDHTRRVAWLVPGLVLAIVVAMPALIHVLRGLASFVLVHRTDLIGRDQAASYDSTVPGQKATHPTEAE